MGSNHCFPGHVIIILTVRNLGETAHRQCFPDRLVGSNFTRLKASWPHGSKPGTGPLSKYLAWLVQMKTSMGVHLQEDRSPGSSGMCGWCREPVGSRFSVTRQLIFVAEEKPYCGQNPAPAGRSSSPGSGVVPALGVTPL